MTLLKIVTLGNYERDFCFSHFVDGFMSRFLSLSLVGPRNLPPRVMKFVPTASNCRLKSPSASPGLSTPPVFRHPPFLVGYLGSNEPRSAMGARFTASRVGKQSQPLPLCNSSLEDEPNMQVLGACCETRICYSSRWSFFPTCFVGMWGGTRGLFARPRSPPAPHRCASSL